MTDYDTESDAMIYHVTSVTDWEQAVAAGQYTPPAFAREGFIHCCHADQLSAVGNRYYHGQRGLVVLCIDPSQVTAPIVHEQAATRPEVFPHIYGPLNVDAVRRVVAFPPQADGTFEVPHDLLA